MKPTDELSKNIAALLKDFENDNAAQFSYISVKRIGSTWQIRYNYTIEDGRK